MRRSRFGFNGKSVVFTASSFPDAVIEGEAGLWDHKARNNHCFFLVHLDIAIEYKGVKGDDGETSRERKQE